MIRRLFGIGFAGFGAWQLWQAYKAIDIYVSRGADLNKTIMEPEFLLPGAGHGLILLGGLLIALATPFGGVITALGVALVTAFAAIIMAMGADSSLWLTKMVSSAGLIFALFLVFRLSRKN